VKAREGIHVCRASETNQVGKEIFYFDCRGETTLLIKTQKCSKIWKSLVILVFLIATNENAEPTRLDPNTVHEASRTQALP
jgi:hypothetical protein